MTHSSAREVGPGAIKMTRWWRLLPIALVFVFAPFPSGSFEQAKPAITSVRAVPPAAQAKPLRSSIHGIERVDDYAWLRDPNWHQVLHDPSALAPTIRAHLEAENRYSEAVPLRTAGKAF